MSAIGFALLAALVAVMSLTLNVSPGRLTCEAIALTLFGLAAYCFYGFGRRDEGPTSSLKKVAFISGITWLAAVAMFGLTDLHLAVEPALAAKTPHNTSFAVVLVSCVFLVALVVTVRRVDVGRPTSWRNGVTALLLVCIVAMIGRSVHVAPRLPAFDLDTPSSL